MVKEIKRQRLSDKVAAIDMSAFLSQEKSVDLPSGSKSSVASTSQQTGVGLVMGAIVNKGELEKNLADTRKKLDEANASLESFKSSKLVQKLDPETVRTSRWANRDEANFVGSEWAVFKREIESAGGNVEPIKVRKVPNGYEIVFGHRRHRACLELGIPVNAVIEEFMDEHTLFAEMDRENRQRENLSAWEQGRMYERALREGLYPSIRKLSQDLGVNLSDASRFCKLAQLPEDVINAFHSPLVIQVRWSKPLSDAMQSDPDGVLERAKQLQSERGKLSPTEVYEHLLQQPLKPKKSGVAINVNGKKAASLLVGPKGRTVVEFEQGVLDASRHEELAQILTEFLQHTPGQTA